MTLVGYPLNIYKGALALSKVLTESEVEQVALDILCFLGYGVLHGPDIAPDGTRPERQSYADVVHFSRLRETIDRLNPKIPTEAKEETIRQLLREDEFHVVAEFEKVIG